MGNKWLMDLMLSISNIFINLCPRFNFLGQSELIHRLKCTLALKKKDVSLAEEFKDHLEGEHRQNGTIDQGKSENDSWKENEQTNIIMFKIMMMLNSNM